MRILLVSDVHLDAPFAWARRDAARHRRQSLRDALAGAIRLALDQRVDAVCCGGDLFEHDRVSPDTGQFLRAQFARLHPIPVFLAPGNHDWLGPESLYRRTAWSPNVTVFADRGLRPVTLAEGLTLWGAAHYAPAGTPDLLQGFRVDRSGVHLALFHGSEASAPYLDEPGKLPQAPFRAQEIEAAGLHFAMLGHYHEPIDRARFSYPGNPEPLTFAETGPRGALILTIAPDGRVATERHIVAVTEVSDLTVEVTACPGKQEVRELIVEKLRGRRGYARVTLTGEIAPDVDLCLADFDNLPHSLDAPPVVRHASVRVAYDLAAIAREPTVRGQFVQDVQASGLPEEERRRIIVTGLRALDGRYDLEVF